MSRFLETMADASRQRCVAAKRSVSLDALRDRARESAAAPTLRLSSRGFDLIAEIKLRSPAEGPLVASSTTSRDAIADRATGYAAAGAAAISVLTEPSRFDGSLKHLQVAARRAAAHDVPVMRKDFLVDPYQLWEARAYGAGGVLLIVALFDDAELHRMLDTARQAGLWVLVEAFDAPELARAANGIAQFDRDSLRPMLLGLNARDLRTLGLTPQRLETLAERFPANVTRVAESGLRSPDDAARLARVGYDAALVGTALMRSDDPAALIRSMLDAGRTDQCESA